MRCVVLSVMVLFAVSAGAHARTGDTITISKASLTALVKAGLLRGKDETEAWTILSQAQKSTTSTTTSATGSASFISSGKRSIEVTIEEMGREATVLSELSRLLSMSNLFYGIGAVLLTLVFGFFVAYLHRGAEKCAVIAVFAFIFHYLGSSLLEKPHSELIGGLMYTVPAFAAPAAMLGLLVEVGMISVQELRTGIHDLVDRSKLPLAERRSRHPNIHRTCLILEMTTMLVAARLYADHPFPGLLAPFFGSGYLALVSLVLLMKGAPFHHMERAITLSDFSLPLVSVMFSVVLVLAAGVGGLLSVIPEAWALSLFQRVLPKLPSGVAALVSSEIVADLMPARMANVVSDVKFACLVTACNCAVVNVPLVMMGVAWVGTWRWAAWPTCDFEVQVQSKATWWNRTTRNNACFLLVVYIMGNLGVLYFGMRSKLLTLAPYGLVSIGLAYFLMRVTAWEGQEGHPFLPGPRWVWIIMLDLPVGVSLLVVSSGYNKCSDTMWIRLLTWLGEPHAFAWVGVLFVRGLCTLTGLAILVASFMERGMAVLDVMILNVAEQPRGVSHLCDPKAMYMVAAGWIGFVLFGFISDDHETFYALKFLLNVAASALLLGSAAVIVAGQIFVDKQGREKADEQYAKALSKAKKRDRVKPRDFIMKHVKVQLSLFVRVALFGLGVRAALFAGDSVLRNLVAIILLAAIIARNPSVSLSVPEAVIFAVLSLTGTATAILVGTKLYSSVGIASIYAQLIMWTLRRTKNIMVIASVLAIMAISTILGGSNLDSFHDATEGALPPWISTTIQGYSTGLLGERIALRAAFKAFGLRSEIFSVMH